MDQFTTLHSSGTHPWFHSTFGVQEPTAFSSFFPTGEDSTFSYSHENETLKVLTTSPPREFHVGRFTTPTVSELRDATTREHFTAHGLGTMRFSNVSGETGSMIRNPENEGAVFQMTSARNCLETGIKFQTGITQIACIRAQGACAALAAPAALLFRMYYAPVCADGTTAPEPSADSDIHVGQLRRRIDLTTDLKNFLEESKAKVTTSDGAISCKTTLDLVLDEGGKDAYNEAVGNVRVGVMWDTETDSPSKHRVAQVIVYAGANQKFESLSRIFLTAAYEATLRAAGVIAIEQKRRVSVKLTQVGNGGIGLPIRWIIDSMGEALAECSYLPLDVENVIFPPGRPINQTWRTFSEDFEKDFPPSEVST